MLLRECLGYADPEMIYKMLTSEKSNLNFGDSKIIDFGCGTGLVCENLVKLAGKKC